MINFNILKLSRKDLQITGPLVFVRLKPIEYKIYTQEKADGIEFDPYHQCRFVQHQVCPVPKGNYQ